MSLFTASEPRACHGHPLSSATSLLLFSHGRVKPALQSGLGIHSFLYNEVNDSVLEDRENEQTP